LTLAHAVAAAAGDTTSACKRGDTRPSELIFQTGTTENLRHLSLDGAPEVPQAGVVVAVTCTVGKSGSLESCAIACADAAAAPFGPAALKRMATVSVREVLRSGAPSSGATTTIDIRFAPTDRFTAAPIDLSRGDSLIFTADPKGKEWTRFYPIRAIRAESEAVLDIACVVREDLSADCPHIAVNVTNDEDGALRPEFEHAARQIARMFRVAPQTNDGNSPFGIWFRKRMRFVLQ
jgi:hypothetical protein